MTLTSFLQTPPVNDPRTLDLELPDALAHFADAVEKSRWMLDLRDNWDDEGAPGYAQATWERAVRFLLESALGVWRAYGIASPAPQIQNGPEGTIDLLWESSDFSLLLNIPVDEVEPASYYGSNARGEEMRGTLDARQPHEFLLLWMKA